MKPWNHVVIIVLCLLGGIFSPPAGLSQVPEVLPRWRVYLTVSDNLKGLSSRAAFGFHPNATLGLDQFLMYGFTDHWTEDDSSYQKEIPSPPLGFFEEIRINNVRQKFSDNGLIFGNIHPSGDASLVDTFIVTFNGSSNFSGDSLYLYTHPQVFSWPGVLSSYADSIILLDIANSGQTIAGPYVHIDMTKDSTFTYMGDTYFDAGSSTYKVDPLNKGFFMIVYHPKADAGAPVVTQLSPPDGATNRPSTDTLRWAAVPGAFYYKVQMDTDRAFSHPAFTDSTLATSKGVSGLHRSPWYYWRVIVSNRYGVGYYQNPPDSFAASPGVISGRVFNDLNGNGAGDPGDIGLPGWKVFLKDPAGALLDSSTTDLSGQFVFSGLNRGAYSLSERQQDDWIRTSPSGVGTIDVTLSKGDTSSANAFGNVHGVKFTGVSGGNWSDPGNWSGGQAPGPTTPAIIPAGITVILNSLPSETILYLRVLEGGNLSCPNDGVRLTVTKAIEIEPGGTIDFPTPPPGTTEMGTAVDTAGIIDYADFINKGTFNPGHSTVTFAGNSPKVIVSTQANTPGGTNFYNLEIAGDSVGGIGNITVAHTLTLGYSLRQRLEDTMTVLNDSSNAIAGTGTIPSGTIARAIRQSETGAYRFESVNSYLQFNGTGTYPSMISITTMPETTLSSFRLKWKLVGGVANPALNTVKAGSISQFSRWVLGIPKPATSEGVPIVNRAYVVKSSGGGGATADLQLDYDQSEVPPGTDESALRLLKGPLAADSVRDKWNMVSLPLIPEDDRKDSLFPGASSPAFAYEGGYAVKPNLLFGQGFWLRYPSAQAVQMIGTDVDRESLAVSAGWNMIGTVSFPTAASSIGSIPPGIVTSRFFGYAGSYGVADSLRPFRAYWVKTSADGRLIFSPSTGALPKVAPPPAQPANFSSLLFRDAGGNEQRLYFGAAENIDLRLFELPPPPPEGAFDVRYATQRLLETVDRQHARDLPIQISSAGYPVTVRWNANGASAAAVLRANGEEIPITGQGELRLAGAGSELHLILSPGGAHVRMKLPREFALDQNYPNPFNPSTAIEYRLPVASNVTLRIYNLLGQELATLVNGAQEAGFRSAVWNASWIASGVYFYRLEAAGTTDPSRSFTRVRKMLLLR